MARLLTVAIDSFTVQVCVETEVRKLKPSFVVFRFKMNGISPLCIVKTTVIMFMTAVLYVKGRLCISLCGFCYLIVLPTRRYASAVHAIWLHAVCLFVCVSATT